VVKRRIIRTFLFIFQPLSRSPEVLDWWSLGKSAAVVLGLGVLLKVLDWLTNLFPGWSAPAIGLLLGLSILSIWAVYQLHVERRIPDNRSELIEAMYHLRNVSVDLIASLFFIASAKRFNDERGKPSGVMALDAERIQEYREAKRKLELQELIAGANFKGILELYRFQIELTTDMCRDSTKPLQNEEYFEARKKVVELADQAIEMLDEGRLYMPKLSTSRKAKSSPPPTS